MYGRNIVHCFLAIFIFGCSVNAKSYETIGQFDAMYGDTTPQLSQIKDSRHDGISFEANQVRISMYLKNTYQGKKLEDFSLPGTQHLKLDYWDAPLSKTSDFFLQILESLELSSQSTWIVDITGSGIWPGNGTLLSRVLHRLPSIKSLYWREGEPIPSEIVRFLEANHPLCRLYYELDFGYWGREVGTTSRKRRTSNPEDEEALAADERHRDITRQSVINSTILYSLKVSVSNGGRRREPYKMDLILSILTTCPNVKELDISVSRGGGCVHYNTDDLYAFNFTSSNATLAPLESLTIYGYRLHNKPNGQDWMEWEADHPQPHILYAPWKYLPNTVINYFGYPKIKEWRGLESSYVKRDTSRLKPGTKANIDVWLERMDWTSLLTLSIKDVSTEDLKLLGGDTLPSLRNVEFSGYYSHHHAILDFLGNASFNLESIQFDGIGFCSLSQVVSTIVDHHGSSLHTLVIKHWQPRKSHYVSPRNRDSYSFPSNSFLNVTHLVQLRESIPGLVTLDLDILVGEEWDYQLLDTITSFSELEYLTLRFEAPVGGWDGDDEDDFLEESLVPPQYGEVRSYKEIDNKLYLMMGLKDYLKKRKVGKQFKKLETWVGSEVVRGPEEHAGIVAARGCTEA